MMKALKQMGYGTGLRPPIIPLVMGKMERAS
jgi:hypothetical protein